MKNLKDFNEFMKSGVIRKKNPDIPRADDLLQESNKLFSYLIDVVKKLGIKDINANSIIKESHDILLGLIRSKMYKDGYFASGQGSHEAEVSYLKKLNLQDSEIYFANQLRYYRNGILYRGKKFDKEYAEKVFNYIKNIREKIK